MVVAPAAPEIEFDSVASTAMFARLGGVRAGVASCGDDPVDATDLASARGYDTDTLQSIAMVGYRYLQSGGLRVAEVLFEGLCAVRPDWSYAHLARGVCRERQGRLAEAWAAYERAARLDPEDPQSRLNLAELALRRGQRETAARMSRRVGDLPAATDAQRERARALLAIIRVQR